MDVQSQDRQQYAYVYGSNMNIAHPGWHRNVTERTGLLQINISIWFLVWSYFLLLLGAEDFISSSFRWFGERRTPVSTQCITWFVHTLVSCFISCRCFAGNVSLLPWCCLKYCFIPAVLQPHLFVYQLSSKTITFPPPVPQQCLFWERGLMSLEKSDISSNPPKCFIPTLRCSVQTIAQRLLLMLLSKKRSNVSVCRAVICGESLSL